MPTTIAELMKGASGSGLAIAGTRRRGLTYGALRSLIGRTHRQLAALRIRSGDALAVSLPNGPETAALFLALASYCRVAPLNPNYTSHEIAFSLRDVNARAIITSVDAAAAIAAAKESRVARIWLRPAPGLTPGAYELEAVDGPIGDSSDPPPRGPDDIALLLHTSGTTARPKLVPLTQRNLCLSARGVAGVLHLTPADGCLLIMPLFHIHGLVAGLLASISAGAAVYCAPGFKATSFFGWLDDSRATWYTAVPTMHQTILARARQNGDVLARHCLRLIRSCSSPLYPAVWEQLESVFGVPLVNAYGMTEAAHQIASVRLPGGLHFRATVGSSAGPEIAILNSTGGLALPGQPGEVVLRGEQLMPGYLQPPGANEAAFTNGWFRTGDEGYLQADGTLTLIGRLKEMINSGGEKISPYEVEEALLSHPSVAQAVAFAAPHRLLGEIVAAAVVVNEGCRPAERDLLAASALRLARHKIPRRIIFLDEIPRGPTGKLQRIGLAARLGILGE
ncbi:MAG: AMP-binding protein [Bryobacteraceae bacterium]